MKIKIVFLVLLFSLPALTYGLDAKCPICGSGSFDVYGCTSTLLAGPGLSFVDGKPVYFPDPNITTCNAMCSEGHLFIIKMKEDDNGNLYIFEVVKSNTD